MDILTYPGDLGAKINCAAALLHNLGLLIRDNPAPCRLSGAKSQSKGLDYVRLWRFLIDQSCFNFVLSDYSLFYFLWDDDSGRRDLAFSFYESPHAVSSMGEFVSKTYGPEYLEILGEAEVQSIMPEFEQFVAELPLRGGVTPVRYDYSEAQYVPGRHPASHLHIGYDNEVRISVDRVLNPISFVAFILRQFYPMVWRNQVLTHHLADVRGHIRDNLSLVEDCFRDELDAYELVLR